MPLTTVAIIAAYNEADIIGEVVKALIDDGVQVYVIDHQSTDGTVAKVERYRDRGLIGLESLPAEEQPGGQGRVFAWQRILKRKEELALELDADWFIHHDADEFRESPWKDQTLAEAIARVDAAGYNAIDFHVFDFKPTTADRMLAKSVRERLQFYEPARTFDRLQIKCWKKTDAPVCLTATGGHEAEFRDRKVFPIRFLLRHYPIRSQAHGERKVLTERLPLYDPAERAKGWHVQYDAHAEGAPFLHDPSQLRLYDPDDARLEVLLRHREVERLEGVAAAAEATADRLRTETESRRQEAIARAADQEALQDRIRQDAAQIYTLSEQLRLQTADADGLRQRAETEASEIQAMRNGLQEYEVECRSLRQRLDEADSQVARLSEQLRARDLQIHVREAEALTARQRLQVTQAEHQALTSEHDRVLQELARLQRDLAGRDVELDRMRAERGRLVGDIQTLRRQLEESVGLIDQLRSETEHLSSTLVDYRNRLTAAESGLAQVLASRSWKVTGPLRAADRWLRRDAVAGRPEGHTAKRESLPVTGGLWLTSDVAVFWDDRWAGRTLEFELGVGQSVTGICIVGFVPAELPRGQELRLKIGDREWSRRVQPGRFEWSIAVELHAHTAHRVLLSAAESWQPSSTGAPNDARELAWQVIEIAGQKAEGPARPERS